MHSSTGLLMICAWCMVSGTEVGGASPDEEMSQVEVKAVFITTDHNKLEDEGDMESRRFQREEMYRHGRLPDCDKKLALTIKLPPDAGKSDGEEYIPVEHVVEGGGAARARLLNPYVLRLRRDAPVQAYPLTLRGTVTVMKSEEDSPPRNRRDVVLSEGDQWAKGLAYIQRLLNTESLSSFKNDLTNASVAPSDLYKKTFYNFSMPKISMKNANFSVDDLQKKVNPVPAPKKPVANCHGSNFDSWKRKKRHEHNIIIENSVDEDKMPIWMAKDQADSYMTATESENSIHKAKDAVKPNEKYTDERSARNSLNPQSKHNRMLKNDNDMNINNKQFTLYDIGDPEFWHTVNVQLFEKESDNTGKTVWSDITMGNTASVGPQNPQYENPNMAIHYRSLDWLDRDKFSLPNKPLCLLVAESDPFSEQVDSEDETSYMIVPEEDISGADHIFRKRYSNYSDINDDDSAQQSSRVQVRLSRAWTGAPEDSLAVVARGGRGYLTMPMRAPPRAQIDLEARADHNTLVRVGASGRINTVTSDSTRAARGVVTVHATNTGLAAASFTVVLKECGPELSSWLQREGRREVSSAPQLVPPRHTRRYSLPLPAALPVDSTRCTVALMNGKGESVAIREVALKKGDRCFCVWHCDCVCLSEDPKLLCREMPPPLLAAAGLSPVERPRRSRGVLSTLMRSCNSNMGPDFFCHTFIRLIAFAWFAIFSLLVAGFMKGVIGIFSLPIAYFWLEYVTRLPPKPLKAYQEPWLKECKVKIDKGGWAVHPRTGKRTVHSMTLMRMIMLNSTLFVILASMTLNNWIRYAISSEARKENPVLPTYGPKYHTMDVQMKPLLLENYRRKDDYIQSSLDSEQDDTQYVLTQMQKSRESLAKSHRKHSGISGGHSSTTHR